MKIFLSLLCAWSVALGPSAWAAPPAVPQAPTSIPQGSEDLPTRPEPHSGLAGQASPAGPPLGYVIGPQDVLKVSVVDEGPEMQNQTAIVDSEGMISFWALKSIAAGGKTIRELQERIAMMLADGFIKNPIVRVEIEKYKSQYVQVLGEVRSPGRIAMTGAKSLLEVLADAGSPTSGAGNEVEVTHTRRLDGAVLNGGSDAERHTTIDLKDLFAAQAYILRDGDVVTVPKAQTFFINGEVRNQGLVIWQRHMTLTQAVTLAGGLTERGTYRSAEATRTVSGKIIKVSLKEETMILPDDVIKIGKRIF
jgi:polysaccharide export outer membrane protein